MIRDCMEFKIMYQVCQYHGKLIRQPPEHIYVHSFVAMLTLGIDIIGPFEKVKIRE